MIKANQPKGEIAAASWPRVETGCVLLLLAVFFGLNLLTGARYPYVWLDEMMYADPAVNLYLGHGFTSVAWYVQHADEFWAGNVPLHAMLLYLWLKVFGLSILAVRSINYFYLAAAAFLLWRGCLRLNLVATAGARLALLGLLICGYSMIISYRSGRLDCVGILLMCASAYVYSRECWRQRIFGLMALGWLMPWAGLQLLPMAAVGGVMLCGFVRNKKMTAAMLALFTGLGAGLVSLYVFFVSHGVWERFRASVGQQTASGFFGWLKQGELRHSNLVPKDFSFLVLLMLALGLAARWLLQKNSRRAAGGGAIPNEEYAAKAIWFGLAFSISLTFALLIAGKFPTYYGWMVYVPMSVCVCAALSRLPAGNLWRRVGGVFLAGAMVIGLGLHVVTAVADWPDRDYRHVEKLISENVGATDRLFGGFTTYYAAKKTGVPMYVPLYQWAMRESEKQSLTVLIIPPQDLNSVTNAIGGNWVSTGRRLMPEHAGFWESRRNMGFLSTEKYDLEVFRRAEAAP